MTQHIYSISAIIPTFNEEANIAKCIASIRKQIYRQDKIEIIIIDDYSIDNTVTIAKKMGARVIYSGKKHIETSKSIGLRNAKGELVLFMDADIFLLSNRWIEKSVQAFCDNPDIVGSQTIYWHYDRRHSIYNRYCELFGVNDPFVYMLGKRGALRSFEKEWINKRAVIENKKDYFLAQFNPDNLPTLGSQGYLASKKKIIQYADWKPYYFHLDSTYQIVAKGHNKFALMKLEVEHNYVNSFFMYHKKLYRNIMLFLRFQRYRTYTYEIGSLKFFLTVFIMISVVYPLLQSIKGYRIKPDIAWFLHPLFCFTVPFVYFYVFVKWNIAVVLKRSTEIIAHKVL